MHPGVENLVVPRAARLLFHNLTPDFFHHIQPVCAITDFQLAECNNVLLMGPGISAFVPQTQVAQ